MTALRKIFAAVREILSHAPGNRPSGKPTLRRQTLSQPADACPRRAATDVYRASITVCLYIISLFGKCQYGKTI